jgi:hypothetical protein
MKSDQIRAAIDDVLQRGSFFVAAPAKLRIERVDREELPWEVFRGHLLDPSHVRSVAHFEVWNVFLDQVAAPAAAPLISIKLQGETCQVHVTRQILTYGFEAYEDPPGVFLSRPVHKWVAELVGTIDLRWFQKDDAALTVELATYVFLAVIGGNRLPITSIESPLPAFSLGQFSYLPRLQGSTGPWTDPVAFLSAALDDQRPLVEQAKALETALRASSTDQLPALVATLERHRVRRQSGLDWLTGLFRAVFNNVALSPYTEFADRMVEVLSELASPERLGAAAVGDVLSFMLRHLCRHLTAFDLTLFHNFGANYPDALFLDALLKDYLRSIESNAVFWLVQTDDTAALVHSKRCRRRALRQACLLRQKYEGHRVPDAPTSLGENLRVLPAPFARVPEEQIAQVAKRQRILFQGDPLDSVLTETSRRALDQSISDLQCAGELRELGMAQFLDRPLGIFKEPGEVDHTPLLSYEAFSRSIAQQRLARMRAAGWMSTERHDDYLAALRALPLLGVAAADVRARERPGVVSLADARKVADDFVFMRTTRGSLADLLLRYDLQPLERASPETGQWLQSTESILLVQHVPPGESLAEATIRIYCQRAILRLELGFVPGPDTMVHYLHRAGVELVPRLQVLRVRASGGGTERDLRDPPVWLEPR